MPPRHSIWWMRATNSVRRATICATSHCLTCFCSFVCSFARLLVSCVRCAIFTVSVVPGKVLPPIKVLPLLRKKPDDEALTKLRDKLEEERLSRYVILFADDLRNAYGPTLSLVHPYLADAPGDTDTPDAKGPAPAPPADAPGTNGTVPAAPDAQQRK